MNFQLFDPDLDSLEYLMEVRKKCQSYLLEGKSLIEFTSNAGGGKTMPLVPIARVLYEVNQCIKDVTGNFGVDQVKIYFV